MILQYSETVYVRHTLTVLRDLSPSCVVRADTPVFLQSVLCYSLYPFSQTFVFGEWTEISSHGTLQDHVRFMRVGRQGGTYLGKVCVGRARMGAVAVSISAKPSYDVALSPPSLED